MASVAQFYTSEHKGLSFELFPPKTEQGDAALMRHMEVLMQFSPDYITCTYGAGGSTQTKTMDVITACLLYTSPSPRDRTRSRMPSSA